MKERTPLKRVAVLYSRLSGYMCACLSALKSQQGVELLVFHWKPSAEAPFATRMYDFIDTLRDKGAYSRELLWAELQRFDPDAVLMSGWIDADYLYAARQLRKRGIPVIAGSDTQWRGTLRQRAAAVVASQYLHPAIDVLWVSGERQRTFARRLGYTGDRCWEGYYACDWEPFARAYRPERNGARTFLYVGRFIELKGLDVLLEAYRAYRAATTEPWDLVCVGAGPLRSVLEREEGVVVPGFVQPHELPELMGKAGAFVLPSRNEPWGVVVQEAAATGLPVICSDVCGASVHLVRDHYNGFVFESGDADQLARLLRHLAGLPEEVRREMAAASHALSKQYTPERWGKQFSDGLTQGSFSRFLG